MFNATKYALAAGLLLVIPAASANAATMTEQCTRMFKKADINGDHSLAGSEAVRYEDALTKSNIHTKDAGVLTKAEFMAACQNGTFKGL